MCFDSSHSETCLDKLFLSPIVCVFLSIAVGTEQQVLQTKLQNEIRGVSFEEEIYA